MEDADVMEIRAEFSNRDHAMRQTVYRDSLLCGHPFMAALEGADMRARTNAETTSEFRLCQSCGFSPRQNLGHDRYVGLSDV